jgi:autotransporter-associated beta strand protein
MTPASIAVSAASGTYAFSGGPIDGSGSLTKSGAGGLTLNAANTFNGGLYIKAGTVTLQNASGAGIGAITLGDTTGTNAATLPSNNFITITNPIILATNGNNPALTIKWTKKNLTTFTGGVTGTNNLILSAENDSPCNLTFSTGSLNNTGTITINGHPNATTTINSVIGANVTGVIQNSTRVYLTNAANAYTGNTTVNAGTLNLNDNAQLKFVIGASGVNN